MNEFRRKVAGAVSFAFVLSGVLLYGTSAAWAQQKASPAQKQIVGVWSLVSSTNTGADGVAGASSFGPNPKGMLIYTSSGHFTSVNTNPSIPKFASGNRLQGTAEENKAVVQGSNASFGTYSISADGKVITHKVEGGTWANWVGTEQKRDLALAGDEMKASFSSTRGGKSVLAYKRVK